MRAALAVGRAVRMPALEHDPEKWEPVFGTRSCSKKHLAAEAILLCLWAAAGLALTGAAFAAGFGVELTQVLGAAG
jgi:hypothetical protein